MKSLQQHAQAFKTLTQQLLLQNSYTIDGVPGTRVDIVRNVINLVSVHWVADYLFGINLKTKENPRGMFTEQEIYDMLSLLFTCVFINVQPEHGWVLRAGASQVGSIINPLIEKSLNEVAPGTSSVRPPPLNPLGGIYANFIYRTSSLAS